MTCMKSNDQELTVGMYRGGYSTDGDNLSWHVQYFGGCEIPYMSCSLFSTTLLLFSVYYSNQSVTLLQDIVDEIEIYLFLASVGCG